jgi:hypothetical protein
VGKKRNVYRLLVGKPEGMRPLEGPRSMWADNIKMDLGEIGWGEGYSLDWPGSGSGQVESSREYDNEPSSSVKY